MFSGIPGVATVDVEQGRFHLVGTGSDFVSGVIGCLAEHRIRVTDFQTENPNLETREVNLFDPEISACPQPVYRRA